VTALRAPRYAPAHSARLKAAARSAPSALPVPIDPARTQGLVMRGFNLGFNRYLALTVRDPAAARAFIGSLVTGDQAWPRITTAAQWLPPAPNRCLSIAFTYVGLEALGLPEASLQSFQGQPDPYPFFAGSESRAAIVGDTGASAPANWTLSDRHFDVMLILTGASQAVIDEDSALLRPEIVKGFDDPFPGRVFDSQGLADHNVYFGYKDGIAQPHIAGVSYLQDPDGGQALVDPSAFMLGTGLAGNPYSGPPLPSPQPLGLHGCFGAFRILLQDVDGFEAEVARLADDPGFRAFFGITLPDVARQAVKALICGRWPNGVPLSVFPVQGDKLPARMLDSKLNDFLFVLPDGEPDVDPTINPDYGSNCPVGAHIRRGNMRGSPFADTPAVYHRIMRRAEAYQVPYDPDDRDKGERGLMGFFMGTSFSDQFEFVQRSWINNAAGFGGVGDTTDPVMGTLGDDQGGFYETLGGLDSSYTFTPMTGFVTTKASAYCFFPGIDGIAWIASQS